MNEDQEVEQLYGERRRSLRFELHIEGHDEFSNRDLLSMAHVLDSATRSAVRDVIRDMAPHLELDDVQLKSLTRKLDDLPAPTYDLGELVEFRKGSWTIVLDVPDTGIVLLFLYLLRSTLGRDIETVWSQTRMSERFRDLLAARVPEAIGNAAQRAAKRFRRNGTLGARHTVQSTEVVQSDNERETRLLIRARRSAIIRPFEDGE